MKLNLAFFSVLCFFFQCLAAIGLISVSPTEINLGEYPSWEERQCVFLLRNTGNENVVLKRIRSTCGCLTSEFISTLLPPGTEYPLKVSIAANSSNGVFNKVIYVETDISEQEFVKLNLKGNAMPLVQITPHSTVYMGKLVVDKEYHHDFKLVPNAKDLQLRLMKIEPDGAASAQMNIKDGFYLLSVTVKPDRKDMLLNITMNIEVISHVKYPPVKIVLRGMTMSKQPFSSF